MREFQGLLLFILCLGFLNGCSQHDGRPVLVVPKKKTEAVILRLGHFPNVTHAQALLGRATGSYEKALGGRIEWQMFNAGPSAVEALFSDSLDATYIGPNPAINGFAKSKGASFVIVAFAASGGAGLVVRRDAGIKSEKDFNGRTVATPQLGNTQDVAARCWFKAQGFKTIDQGGALNLLPLRNPDQLLMFQRKEIDAAWTVEPWISRLEQEGGGQLFLDERTLWPQGRFVTTVLIVRRAFLAQHRDVVERLVAAHVEATRIINADKAKASTVINEEIKRETMKALAEPVILSAMQRVDFSWEPLMAELELAARNAEAVGMLKCPDDLARLWDPQFISRYGPSTVPAVSAPDGKK